jgi:hypothetical protein
MSKWGYLDILLYVFWRKGELLWHSPMRILKEWRVTWTFSYKNVQVTVLSFKIRIGECPSKSPFLQNTHRRMSMKEWRVTWTFSYAYFEGKESYFDILLYVFWRKGELLGLSVPSKYAYENVQVTVLSFKIRIGECPSKSPFLQNTYRRMSK